MLVSFFSFAQETDTKATASSSQTSSFQIYPNPATQSIVYFKHWNYFWRNSNLWCFWWNCFNRKNFIKIFRYFKIGSWCVCSSGYSKRNCYLKKVNCEL